MLLPARGACVETNSSPTEPVMAGRSPLGERELKPDRTVRERVS